MGLIQNIDQTLRESKAKDKELIQHEGMRAVRVFFSLSRVQVSPWPLPHSQTISISNRRRGKELLLFNDLGRD